jgi:hypothetical protein
MPDGEELPSARGSQHDGWSRRKRRQMTKGQEAMIAAADLIEPIKQEDQTKSR